jgi:hypothetical protein
VRKRESGKEMYWKMLLESPSGRTLLLLLTKLGIKLRQEKKKAKKIINQSLSIFGIKKLDKKTGEKEEKSMSFSLTFTQQIYSMFIHYLILFYKIIPYTKSLTRNFKWKSLKIYVRA